jgi:hypothetical protein
LITVLALGLVVFQVAKPIAMRVTGEHSALMLVAARL